MWLSVLSVSQMLWGKAGRSRRVRRQTVFRLRRGGARKAGGARVLRRVGRSRRLIYLATRDVSEC